MLTTIGALLPNTAPGFATRFRWAIEARDRAALVALRAEDPDAYARFLSQHRAAQQASSEPDAAKLEVARELRRQARAARLQQGKAAITDEMRRALVDESFDVTEAVSVASKWWKQRETPWLILCGPSSCGKSVAAAAAVAAHGGLWLSSNEVVQTFTAMFGPPASMQQRAKEETLLVIDELGVEDEPTRMSSALLQLLNTRNSAERTPTIATTNVTLEALAGRYGNERIRLRLNELVTWAPLPPACLRPSHPLLFTREP